MAAVALQCSGEGGRGAAEAFGGEERAGRVGATHAPGQHEERTHHHVDLREELQDDGLLGGARDEVTSGDVRDEEEANAVQPGQARLLGGRGGGGGGVFGRGSQRLSPTQVGEVNPAGQRGSLAMPQGCKAVRSTSLTRCDRRDRSVSRATSACAIT